MLIFHSLSNDTVKAARAGRVLLMEDLYPLAGFPSDGGQALDVLAHLLHGKAGGAP